MNATGPTPPPFFAHDRRGAWMALVSGRRRGLVAGLERCGLSILAGLYRAGLAVHDLRWNLASAVAEAPCLVISVGNLTVGGTGKTPMVAYLARLLTGMGRRPLIVSRGYGSIGGELNEEARELLALCPGVPHVQNPDRLQAILEWTAANPCDAVILDDGFQHRRLARDLDLVMIDAMQPFGYGHVLPRGLLRERKSALARADFVVITRAELVDAVEVTRIKRTVPLYAHPNTPVVVAEHRPTGLILSDGSRCEVDWLDHQDVAAACGIGNPEAFRWTLRQAGANVRLFNVFDDHHAYTAGELQRLLAATEAAGLKTLVTTGKDFVKWQPLLAGRQSLPPVEVAALEVTMQVLEGEETLRREMTALLHR